MIRPRSSQHLRYISRKTANANLSQEGENFALIALICATDAVLIGRLRMNQRHHSSFFLRPPPFTSIMLPIRENFVTEEQLEVARNRAIQQASSRGKADRFILSSATKSSSDLNRNLHPS